MRIAVARYPHVLDCTLPVMERAATLVSDGGDRVSTAIDEVRARLKEP